MTKQRRFRARGRVRSTWDRIDDLRHDLLAPLSGRERLIYSLLLIGLGFLIFVAPTRAFIDDEGKIFRIAPLTCSSDDSWFAAELASGQPSVSASESSTDINSENAAFWQNRSGEIACTNYNINPEHAVQNAIANISIRSLESLPSEELGELPNLDAGSQNFDPIEIQSRDKPIIPNALDSEAVAVVDSFLEISYSTDKGDSWNLLHQFNSNIIDRDNPYLSVALPNNINIEPERFSLKVEIVSSISDVTILLDSMAISYEVSHQDEISLDFLESDNDENRLVLNSEQIKFKLKAKNPADGIWQGLGTRIADNDGPQVSTSIEILNKNDEVVASGPIDLDWQGSDLSNRATWEATVDTSEFQIEPGEYQMKVTYTSDDGRSQTTTQDFLWGVLALNTNKSLYEDNETGHIMISVLDELGKTICDAELELTISINQDSSTYSTSGRDLIPTDTCDVYGDHIQADYQQMHQFSGLGEHQLKLIATTENGTYEINDSVVVEEFRNIPLNIERSGPTRVYPIVDYPMSLFVSAQQDFSGTITEVVPASFEIKPSTTAKPHDTLVTEGETQIISWKVEIKAGEILQVGYVFDAPDVSPEFYVLGPAKLIANEIELFSESRQWQLAGDAVGRMLLFFDGGTVPTGWTCVSCMSGDPFYQNFVRGAATYGGTGGATTHTHTASGAVVSLGATGVGNAQSGTIAVNAHTHTYSPTLDSPSNLPAYRQLKVIRHNTTGEPTTIPNGAIAVFDAAVPSGWTRYSAQDGSYIRGENTAGTTGGSNTHSVTISGTTSTAGGSNDRQRSGGTQTGVALLTHNHSVSGNSDTVNNEPSYIEVILGKIDADGSAPNDMIAMWDEDPDSGWNSVSGASQAFNAQFIKPAATYGTTGGADTHSHANTALTSGAPSTTASSRTGSSSASSTHTHTVNVTGYSTENHLPPYREAVFAKRSKQPTYEQSAYRWYDNDNSTDVGSTLAALNTAATAPTQGTPFRLRLALHLTVEQMDLNEENFKLQFALRSGTCDTSFTGETYTDVATASGDIRYHDNSSPADGAALTSNANDPTHSSDTVNDQTYEEANNFTNSQSSVAIGEDGLWDFSLVDFSAPGSTAYCFRVVKSAGTVLTTYTVIPEITTAVPPPRMILLYDGATIPSGWTCVSCMSGDEAYQRFIRGEATSNTGGNATHTHTASGAVGAGSANDGRNNDGAGIAENDHGHTYTPVIGNANNLPAYRQLKVIRYNTGTPATIPSGAIALFDAAVPGGWTRYSAQDGSFVRGEGTAGTTGGSNTQSHTITGNTSASTGATDTVNTSGQQELVATDTHTHSVNGNSDAVDIQPPFIETILGQANADTTIPGAMIAMWDSDPGGTWTCVSCVGADAFYQTFFKPAATYGTTGGSATHTHGTANITSGTPSATIQTRTGNALAADTHTHSITVNNFSTDNHLPEYIDYIFAQSPSSNTAPNNPTNLAQEKTDMTNLAVGDWTNESSVVFMADATDPDNPDSLALCVEVELLGTAFDNVDTACGSTVAYSGSAVAVEVNVGSLTDGGEYHWQARIKDGVGAFSSWVSFGGNAESARDFAVDSSGPTGTVYDGTTIGVDIDFNNGDLDELSANWNIDSSASGLSGYEYSIGTSPGATDVVGWTSNGTSTSVTASSLSLNTSQPYYFNVRTTDNAGSQSVISTDGILVSPTLSFSTNTTEIAFGALNAGNSYTSTVNSIVTTSTNAYNGYEVRAYATGLLTSPNSDTIAVFSGGTYALPDEWLGGDTGYGYTSSDTTIQGVDKFNDTPCPGGNNPPCYAPVSLTAPGDIIADHTSLVSGTPIVNEQFTITHRVTTDSDQEAGTYTTTLIYSITAIY